MTERTASSLGHDMKLPDGWKWYPPTGYFAEGSAGFWQKKLDDAHYVQVIKYDAPHSNLKYPRFEVEFDCEVDGKTARVKLFTYFKVNFKKFESEARRIIKVVEE